MIKNNGLIRDIDGNTSSSSSMKPLIIGVLIAIVLGLGSGYVGAQMKNKSAGGSMSTGTTGSNEKVKETAGIADKKTFTDKAEGILKEGGIEDEGSFHLERPGGVSQNVYLTSSTVDLSTYIGKKVRVWGKTFSGKKAGWLMDVGYVEVLQ